ncbi:hypothetical protein GJAV_G00071400 [Gymnothorax javanicus]|nr:hypothetical protein GJAV_G00071400 [Gymnothorax javanicus]
MDDYDDYIKLQMKENGIAFKNALERIVEKYSRVDGSGVEVCLESMTCRTEDGIRPWDGNEVERQMKSMKAIADAMGNSTGGHDISEDIQMEDSQTCSDCTSVSMETEMEGGAENVSWESGPNGSWLLSGAVNTSGLQGELDKRDETLERTLSSHGSMLEDLYPSMLCRVRQAWHRQEVTAAANAVLRRYRRQGWRSRTSKSHPSKLHSPVPSAPKSHPSKLCSPVSRTPKSHPSKLHSPSPSSPKSHPSKFHSPVPSSPKTHPSKLHSPVPSSPKSHPSKLHSPVPSAPRFHPPKLHSPKLHPHSTSPKLCPRGHSPYEPGRRGLQAGGVGQSMESVRVIDRGGPPESLSRTHTVLHPFRPVRGPAGQAGGVEQSMESVRVIDSGSPPESLSRTHTVLHPFSPVRGTAGQAGEVEQSMESVQVIDSGSPPESLSRTHTVVRPFSPVRGTPGLHQSHSISPNRSAQIALQPFYQRQSPCPASRPNRLPQRPPPPQISSSQSGRGFRRHSFSGFRTSRQQIDQQFEELYHRLVCKRKPSHAYPLPSSSSFSSSLAALALSPVWSRVQKRDRGLESGTVPEPKRYREARAFSPGSIRELQQSRARCCPHALPVAPEVPSNSPGAPSATRLLSSSFRKRRLYGGEFQKDLCSTFTLRDDPQTCVAEYEGKSTLRDSISLKDWQREFSPSRLSRRRLLYSIAQ